LSITVCCTMFFDYCDPGAGREFAHRCGKIDVLVFHYEPESAAACAAAKTMECLPTRAHHERRCFFLMKRAERLEIRSCAFQGEIRAVHFDDVVCRRNLLDCF